MRDWKTAFTCSFYVGKLRHSLIAQAANYCKHRDPEHNAINHATFRCNTSQQQISWSEQGNFSENFVTDKIPLSLIHAALSKRREQVKNTMFNTKNINKFQAPMYFSGYYIN